MFYQSWLKTIKLQNAAICIPFRIWYIPSLLWILLQGSHVVNSRISNAPCYNFSTIKNFSKTSSCIADAASGTLYLSFIFRPKTIKLLSRAVCGFKLGYKKSCNELLVTRCDTTWGSVFQTICLFLMICLRNRRKVAYLLYRFCKHPVYKILFPSASTANLPF